MGSAEWLINPFTMGCAFTNCAHFRHKLNIWNRVEYIVEDKVSH